jgi:hypothetical protein
MPVGTLIVDILAFGFTTCCPPTFQFFWPWQAPTWWWIFKGFSADLFIPSFLL